MPRRDETVAVRATAAGTGGIALVEVIGPAAHAVVAKFVKPGALAHGQIVDEVLAHFGRRLGEPVVEIGCHGGPAAVCAVIEALGVREVDRAFVLDRAVAARRIDRTRAEALLLLPKALTLRAARMLQDQANGALAKAKSLKALRASATLGLALVEPRRVVIAGPQNVGKSTLFNELVERDRALVSPIAGSTRDPVEETIAIDGIPFILVDTAGLGTPGSDLDAVAMQRTNDEIKRAALVIEVPKSPRDVRRDILKRLGLTGKSRPRAPVVFTERQREIVESGKDWRRRLLGR